MVFINVVKEDPMIVLDCHKQTEDGEYFRLVIDPKTKEVIEKPDDYDIDATTAYSRIFGYLMKNKPLPKRTVAEWG